MAESKAVACKAARGGVRWMDLPVELKEGILARLPVSHLLRLRSVCKDWRSMISSPTFLKLYYYNLQDPLAVRKEEWLVVYASDTFFAYIPSFRKWVHLDLNHALLPAGSHVRGLVAAGGLLCVYSYNFNLYTRSFVVCNPLTKARKLLPLLPMSSAVTTWTMIVDNTSKAYKVIVLNMSTPAVLQVYDSESCQWIQTTLSQGTAPAQGHRDIVFRHSATCISKVVYCIDCTQGSVFAYDIGKDDWSKINAPFPQGFGIWKENIFVFPRFVQGVLNKRLMLVGGLIQGEIMESIGVVWELDTSTMTWCEIARAPDHMWKEMLECCYMADEFPIRVQFTGGGGLICVTMVPCCQVLVYDIHKKSWQKLPNLPVPYLECAASYFYEPRLDAQLTTPANLSLAPWMADDL
ncbi:hypothetical protein O6H91_22G023300 [Diphasiastrum complanatum]|uniref:Uncharacterized protein n=2 Tax=Diphasiastrum complanatum TaxID=34168 RepID=A0ACC2ADN3_DIPCM|nr:hypothetical protein O6H91_22G023100 [Diphasiastrum complanatum]KAJ7515683.1 hypothetical protein O6H91_22G023300 [Diphasiastrum complanatum]